MRALIVFAYPETGSFHGALLQEARAALVEDGHEVKVSDLYALGFDPVSDRRNFTTRADASRLDLQNEEAHASRQGGYVPSLRAEMDKLAWCDFLILQFPIWWLGPPAILKGWIDRVFAVGQAYGGGRWFDEGMLNGKRAMCVVTTGGPSSVYARDGVYAPMAEILLPLHLGALGFVGFTVLEPLAFYGPGRWMSARERADALARYRDRLRNLDSAPQVRQPTAQTLRRHLNRVTRS
ncbi:NAD(P)H-dependent oxidoreductase [Xanthobacter aminoxidans]|uniref:NAD(P)H-dependent oxidoreductase n=1 Tax=Xanthobacter aminoxidans TaxID=186280 RepID=UPI00372CE39B